MPRQAGVDGEPDKTGVFSEVHHMHRQARMGSGAQVHCYSSAFGAIKLQYQFYWHS